MSSITQKCRETDLIEVPSAKLDALQSLPIKSVIIVSCSSRYGFNLAAYKL